MPWKNGAGETTEIAVSPLGASLDAIDWRLSMASVAADGPFSIFEGIDRTLAVLEGEGIRLSFGNSAPVALSPSSPPFCFRGDVSVTGNLLGGPITDFNVMTRRGTFRHQVSVIADRAIREPDLAPGIAAVHCTKGRCLISASSGVLSMAAGETALAEIDRPTIWRIEASAGSVSYLVSID
jgi:environmental stress-induced protein Ves